jgi:FixJ family two-component response regulator
MTQCGESREFGRRALLDNNVVLVVDDDRGFLKSVERVLRAHGFQVEAFDSAEAFQNHNDSRDALCVVLDVHLGDASGIELGRHLARAGIWVPVIYITGNDSDVVRKAAFETGCLAYLRKPFPTSSLIAAIEKARLTSRVRSVPQE